MCSTSMNKQECSEHSLYCLGEEPLTECRCFPQPQHTASNLAAKQHRVFSNVLEFLLDLEASIYI